MLATTTLEKKDKKEGVEVIKTPQSLIHIKHRISLLQYKYWILLLRELREQFDAGTSPDENGFRYISMSKIAADLGYTPNKTEIFKDFLALKNETIAFNVLEKDGQEAKYGAGFISEWKVTSQRVAFKFPSMLENVMRGLAEPKAIFQLLNWSIFNHFSGKYEAIIYKLCKDYVGVQKTPYMTVEEFREYMGLSVTEYAPFMKLNEWVIKRPCDRINDSEVSDIEVQPDYERQGRKVLGLRFLVKKKHQTTIQFPEFETSPVFRFAKVHLEPAAQQEYLSLREPDEVELCIERANEYGEQQEKAGKTVNYGGLYRKSIAEGWHVQHQEKTAKKEAVDTRKRKAVAEVSVATETEKLHAEYLVQKITDALAHFDALPTDRKDGIRALFLASLPVLGMKKSFEKNGERHTIHRAAFVKFLEKQSLQ